MTAGLSTLHDEQINAGRNLAQRVLLGATQRADRHAVVAAHPHHLRRWHTERVDDQLDRVSKRNLQNVHGAAAIERLRLVVRRTDVVELDAVLLEQCPGVRPVLRRALAPRGCCR